MEHIYNTSMRSKIITLQKEYLERALERALKRAGSQEEADALINEFFKTYYMNVGSPLLQKRYAEEGHLPYIEDYNMTTGEMAIDLDIIFEETGLIGDAMAHYFNYAQNERTRIRNRIQKIGSSANDLALLSSNNKKNDLYFKDSFNSRETIEDKMVIGAMADIMTEQGVVTLKRVSTFNQSQDASIKLLKGDGEAGTYHVAKQQAIPTASENYSMNATYISDETPNDDPNAILDGRPDTIFEYQMVNMPRDIIVDKMKSYDVSWVKGSKSGDRLRLHLVLELAEEVDINWININPYHAPGSTGNVKVYSIRTSADGFDYQALYDADDYVLNAEINIVPQTYNMEELFSGTDDMRVSKFAGQGVWSFTPRRTKFVEIVLDQDQSYEELIGHTYYEMVNPPDASKDGGAGKEGKGVRIPESQVSTFIAEAPHGRYMLNSTNAYIDKKLEVHPGWRYAIGLRDINVMSYEYAPKSEIISTKYTTNRPIRNVLLYVNEKIPKEFLEVVATGNEWIKYYISYDDVNWHRISPMHHQPLGKASEFPAKIIEFNLNELSPVGVVGIHKTQLKVESPVNGIRFKAVMERPADERFKHLTPMIEDYSLQVVLDEI